jgi:HAD superfamily hydrolase (TIGR01509 family)
MKFAAVIFDLDGTIIKSEEEWGKAFTAVLQKLGVKTNDKNLLTRGAAIKSNWQKLLTKYDIKTDKTFEELEILTYAEYEKLIPEIALNDGVLEFMDVLKENGTPLSLATLTNWETVTKVVEHFRLNNYFESITTGEEVVNPKPSPDIFLLASDKLGVEPADCLVIEDSLSGVAAAKEAGMKVIAVSDGENVNLLENADLVVSGFPEITLKAIDAVSLD